MSAGYVATARNTGQASALEDKIPGDRGPLTPKDNLMSVGDVATARNTGLVSAL